MARRLITLSSRLVLVVLGIHAVLLPVLFYGMSAVVRQSMALAFVDDARVQGRLLADSLELDPNAPMSVLEEQLDSAILGGRIIHASVQRGEIEISSSLMSAEDLALFDEDYEFGEHDDATYYLSLPIVTGQTMANLRLGFDESETRDNFESVQQSIVIVIVAYLFTTLFATIYLSNAVVRPIRWLQRASHTVASGEYDKRIETDSNLIEIKELTRDLELMRSNLMKVSVRLRHAQKLESLGTLAGGVAHEFNNVLQPILLYTELALEDLPDDSPIAENMARVRELAVRARGLSQQILTFGRIGNESEFREVMVIPVVEEAITMIRALLPATVDIRFEVEGELGTVRGDPAQIQQLIVNLCNNAFQALSAPGGHIRVSLGRESVTEEKASRHPNLRPEEYAVLEVADTGHGMDAETLERVYEPFFTTQDVGEGTGLGLSVVHGIVMRHDGEIALQSAPGAGTQIKVYLPINRTGHGND